MGVRFLTVGKGVTSTERMKLEYNLLWYWIRIGGIDMNPCMKYITHTHTHTHNFPAVSFDWT